MLSRSVTAGLVRFFSRQVESGNPSRVGFLRARENPTRCQV